MRGIVGREDDRTETWRVQALLHFAALLVIVTGGRILGGRFTDGGPAHGEVVIPLLCVAAAVAVFWAGPNWGVGTAGAIGLSGLVLSAAIGIGASVDPWMSFLFSFPVIGLAFAFVGSVWSPAPGRALAWALVLLGTSLAISVLVGAAAVAVQRWGFVETVSGVRVFDIALVPRGFGFTPNPNHAALMLLIPFGVALALLARRGYEGALATFAAVFIVIGVLATGSRGGLVASAMILVARLGIALRQPGLKRPIIARLAVPAVVFSTGAVYMWPTASARGVVRGEVWSAAARLFVERPVTGWGPATLATLLPAYMKDPAIFEPEMWHAHNVYLEMLTTLGLLGGAILIGMLIIAWRFDAHRRPQRASSLETLEGTGAVLGLSGLAIHGLVESFQLYAQVLVLIGVAVAVYWKAGETRKRQPGNALARSALLVAAAVIVAGAIVPLETVRRAETVADLADLGRWEQVVATVDHSPEPGAGRLAPALVKALFEMGDVEEARRAARLATEHRPEDSSRWLALAQVSEDGAEVRSALIQAYEQGSMTSPVGKLSTIELAAGGGDLQKAAVYLLVRQYPEVVASDYWRDHEDLEVFRKALARYASSGGACVLSVVVGASDTRFTDCSLAVSDRLDNLTGEPDQVVRIAGVFYESMRSGRPDYEVLRGLDSGQYAKSPLARRLRGLRYQHAGEAAMAKRELAMALLLGDLESANLLLDLDLSPEQRSLVVAQGRTVLSLMRPFGVREGIVSPNADRHWMALQLGIPLDRSSYFLVPSAYAVLPDAAVRFLDRSGS